MRKYSRAAVVLFTLVLLVFADAQVQKRLTMSGVVSDQQSHAPVEGAAITLVGNQANLGTTDREGSFVLNLSVGVQEGSSVRIRVEKAGYKVYDKWVAVSTTIPLQVPLEPLSPRAPVKHTDSAHFGEVNIKMPRDGWMAEWGAKPPNVVRVVARAEPFLPYRGAVHLMLICRVVDNTIDEMQDTAIEKSVLFSPTQAQFEMEMTLSQSFLQRASTHAPQMAHVSLVFLPRNANPANILKLADVERVGGSILITNGFGLALASQIERTGNINQSGGGNNAVIGNGNVVGNTLNLPGPVAPNDPIFPNSIDLQVAEWMIQETKKINDKEHECQYTRRRELDAGASGEGAKFSFWSEIRECCAAETQKLHDSILNRLPSAKEGEGEFSYEQHFKRNLRPDQTPSECGVALWVTEYLERMGKKLKLQVAPRPDPKELRFSEGQVPANDKGLSYAMVATIQTDTRLPPGYIVVELDTMEDLASTGCDLCEREPFIPNNRDPDNTELTEYIAQLSQRRVLGGVWKLQKSFTPDNPFHFGAEGSKPVHVKKVMFFAE
ncbi:MAG TPA: carboxypeptidase-like regulatory domain-containing protein [Terriglobales bacterium]|nr:carboxypeptidase-like regulatory domain-containing protein [Terriglobales bacterium]